MKRTIIQLFACLFIIGAFIGCHPRPEDAEGAGKAGSVRQVDLGGITSANHAIEGKDAPRVIPVRDWVKPAVPLIEPPQVISIWFYPRKSLDGLAYREGFWCHRVVRAFAWGQERAMHEQGVNLNTGAITPDRISLTPGEQTAIEPQSWFLDSMSNTPRGVPMTERTLPAPGAVRTIPSSINGDNGATP